MSKRVLKNRWHLTCSPLSFFVRCGEKRCWSGRYAIVLSRWQGVRAEKVQPMQKEREAEQAMKRAKTPTFLLELPLRVDWSQEHRLRAHLEVARCLYNALLGEANKRLRRMRNDPAWASARALPHTNKQGRAQAFSALRKQYRFSEYELHE